MQSLKGYDHAVAQQALDLLRARGAIVDDPAIREATRAAGPDVSQAYDEYREAWRATQIARASSR